MAVALAITYSAAVRDRRCSAVPRREDHVRRIGAVLIGFAGVLIVLRPGSMPMTPGIAAAMIAAVTTAFSLVAIRQLVGSDDSRSVTVWSFVQSAGISGGGAVLVEMAGA